MSTVSRKEFVAKLAGNDGFIDVNQVSPELRDALSRAGVTDAALVKIGSKDGLISGDEEMGQLFKLVESYDTNGSARSFEASSEGVDGQVYATASGELYDALRTEVNERVRMARAAGADGPTARSPNVKRLDDKALVEEASTRRARLDTIGNYPSRSADEATLRGLEREIDRRVAVKTGVKNPSAHSDGTTWAERQTGRCMTNIEVYQYTLEHAKPSFSDDLESEALEQRQLFEQNANQVRLWPDGTQATWQRLHAAELGANAGDMVLAVAARPGPVTVVRAPALVYAGPVQRSGVHGNSAASTVPTHHYVILSTNVKTGEVKVWKVGVGAQGETTKGMSVRAEQQVRKQNKQSDELVFSSVIIDRTAPNRGEAYNIERDYVTEYVLGHGAKPAGQKLPNPWPDNETPERPWQDPS